MLNYIITIITYFIFMSLPALFLFTVASFFYICIKANFLLKVCSSLTKEAPSLFCGILGTLCCYILVLGYLLYLLKNFYMFSHLWSFPLLLSISLSFKLVSPVSFISILANHNLDINSCFPSYYLYIVSLIFFYAWL